MDINDVIQRFELMIQDGVNVYLRITYASEDQEKICIDTLQFVKTVLYEISADVDKNSIEAIKNIEKFICYDGVNRLRDLLRGLLIPTGTIAELDSNIRFDNEEYYKDVEAIFESIDIINAEVVRLYGYNKKYLD